jgi:hypothetical protein
LASLFTRIALGDTLQVISQHILAEIKVQTKHVLTTTCFLIEGTCYEQIGGVAMASPLAARVTNFYMEKFEQEALSTVKKPAHWYG